MNNIAPIKEVTTPMGSSKGFSNIRAIRSASIRKVAPPNKEAGSSLLWFGPVSIRTMWGTTKPTNPIVPPMDTHTPISPETAIIMINFTLLTFTPICRAFSSPMAKAFNSLACKRIIMPNITKAMKSTRAFS